MASDSTFSNVLSFEDARHVVEEHAAKLRPRDPEKLELLHAVGIFTLERGEVPRVSARPARPTLATGRPALKLVRSAPPQYG